MTTRVVTHSPAQTFELARGVGGLLRAGDVVVLTGELGTGKTVVTKGIAAALGIDEPVLSPTFTVVREYDAPLPLVHVDVYRLENLRELHDVGFDDLVGSDAVTVVEWGERVRSALPEDRLEIRLALGLGDDDRAITLDAYGPSWEQRVGALAGVAAVRSVQDDTAGGPG